MHKMVFIVLSLRGFTNSKDQILVPQEVYVPQFEILT